MSALQKIGLFGGTFDPVHLGHLHLATLAKDLLLLDEVRFLPCRISPHKTGHAPASGEDRCEMLRRATVSTPWAVVDDSELRDEGPSYSYLTAEAMAEKFPTARLFWIMGSDQWDALPRWQNPERLGSCVAFIVLARGSSPALREGYQLHVLDGGHPASASVIREEISNGLTNPPWLSADVADWISERGLYQA